MILMVRVFVSSMVKFSRRHEKRCSKRKYDRRRIFDRFLTDFGVMCGGNIEEISVQDDIEMKLK